MVAGGIALGLSLGDGASDATARSARTPPELRTALRPGLQLAAMRAGIQAGPAAYAAANSSGCNRTTVVLAYDDGGVLAGNFRDTGSNCYVWLNLAHSPLLNGQEICKLALHEVGHLNGLRHSSDPADVMYSPFNAQPIPAECRRPFGARR